MKKNTKLKVSIVMGSQSDYKTMRLTEKILNKIGVSFETKIISAHRTTKRMYDYATTAKKNNISFYNSHDDYKNFSKVWLICYEPINVFDCSPKNYFFSNWSENDKVEYHLIKSKLYEK